MTPVRLLASIASGAAFAAAVMYGLWRLLGPVGLALGAPAVAVLAWPLVEILTGFPRLATRLALRRIEGRHFSFRDRAMDIHIDADARCWVSTADARKVVALPADAVLSRVAPQHCGELGDPVRCRITVEGLAQVLSRSSDAEVTKFCNWLEKDVARPARNRRDGRKIPG